MTNFNWFLIFCSDNSIIHSFEGWLSRDIWKKGRPIRGGKFGNGCLKKHNFFYLVLILRGLLHHNMGPCLSRDVYSLERTSSQSSICEAWIRDICYALQRGTMVVLICMSLVWSNVEYWKVRWNLNLAYSFVQILVCRSLRSPSSIPWWVPYIQ